MSIRTIRISLWCCTAIGAATGILVAALIAASPLDQDLPVAAPPHIAPANRVHANDRFTTLANLSDLDLRRPLTDAAAAAPTEDAVAASSKSPPAIHLVGTVVEVGHTVALFTGKDGRPEFKGAGDDIDGARIVEIRDRAVTLLWNDRPIEVAIAPTPADGLTAASAPIVTTDRSQAIDRSLARDERSTDDIRKLLGRPFIPEEKP